MGVPTPPRPAACAQCKKPLGKTMPRCVINGMWYCTDCTYRQDFKLDPIEDAPKQKRIRRRPKQDKLFTPYP